LGISENEGESSGQAFMPHPCLFLSKTIGVRVTEDDYAHLQVLASAQGKTVAEWCREIIFERVKGREEPSGVLEHIILEELLAFRMLATSLLYNLTNDVTKGKISPEQMEELIKQVDQAKLRRAKEILGPAVKRYTG
jgi:hypothetical protein